VKTRIKPGFQLERRASQNLGALMYLFRSEGRKIVTYF